LRMKHRGGARKRVVRVRLDGAMPARGTPIMDGGLARSRCHGWIG
jgi:hypothetical protein